MNANKRQWTTFEIIYCVLVIIIISVFLQIYIYILIEDSLYEESEVKDNIVLWWTPFTGDSGTIKKCGGVRCFFTNDVSYQHHPNIKAFLFYGSGFNKTNLPIPRGILLWGLLHEESPRNTPVLSHEPMLSLFNVSSTFSRHSDVPLTLQYLTSLQDLTSKSYFLPVEEKNKLLSKLSPVVYIQSDCVTPTNRDSYVSELMKYIKIDSYGQCLKNKEIPKSLEDPMKNLFTPEMFKFVAQYKFAIAFENAVCDDYITEKLWRPLISGVIPIYIGSATVKDWVPNNNSVILALDFETPQKLAAYLQRLNNNNDEYNQFLAHKINGIIENTALIDQMVHRLWSLDENYDTINFVEDFECHVCQRTYGLNYSVVSAIHYNCPKPLSILSNKFNASNWWHNDWDLTKCEATTLRRLIDNHTPYTEAQLTEMTVQNMQSGNCI